MESIKHKNICLIVKKSLSDVRYFFRETIGRLGQDLEKGEKGSFHQCLPRSEKSSNFPYPMFYVDNYSVMFFDVFLNAKKTSIQSLKITTKTDKTLAETIHTMGRHRAVSLPKVSSFPRVLLHGSEGSVPAPAE